MKNKQVARSRRNSAWRVMALAGVLVGVFAVPLARAHHVGPSGSHGKARGIVGHVPGGSLVLPLPTGSFPVDMTLALGGPGGPELPFKITSDTLVSAEDLDEGLATITLRNGDGAKVKAKLLNGVLVAVELTIEEYIEAEPQGFVVELPPGVSSTTVPLPPGTSNVPFVLRLGDGNDGPNLPIVITSDTTVIGGGSLQIRISDFIEAKIVLLQNGELRAFKVGLP